MDLYRGGTLPSVHGPTAPEVPLSGRYWLGVVRDAPVKAPRG